MSRALPTNNKKKKLMKNIRKVYKIFFIKIYKERDSVKVRMVLSEPFDTMRGYRQGDPLSCDLFNFVVESVLRKAGVHRNGTNFS